MQRERDRESQQKMKDYIKVDFFFVVSWLVNNMLHVILMRHRKFQQFKAQCFVRNYIEDWK